MTRIKRLRIRNRGVKKDLFTDKRSFAFLFFILFSILAMIVTYVIFDNSHVVADRVSVTVQGLPKEFENFTALLITDLHGRNFGGDQSEILDALGGSNFDVALLGGDMIDERTGDSEALFALADRLAETGKPIYYTPGNHDPAIYVREDGVCAPHPVTQGLLDRGVKILEAPVLLKSSETSGIWLWPTDQLSTDADAEIATIEDNLALLSMIDTPVAKAEKAHHEILLANAMKLKEAREAAGEEDIHIALSHYPMTPAHQETVMDVEQEYGPNIMDASLLMAGHYHAGQWRVPGYGAVWVPAAELPLDGWFPDQTLVAGLHRIEGLTQYVSRGLGATGPAPVRFRLFNTPQAALLQLTSRAAG